MATPSNTSFFDKAVIDSNFFIGLVETGYDKRILRILKDSRATTIECVMPEQLPISDIPRKYRELRRILSKYITGLEVDRKSKFWEWSADVATKKHFIRARDDPADIDVFVLARRLEKMGQKVVVVSDDEGVIRSCREITEFQNLGTMSSGAFLFSLGALVTNENIQKLLEEAGNKIYTKFLAYRRKSRRYIDISSLVAELRDTSKYVKMAASSQAHISKPQPKAKSKTKSKKDQDIVIEETVVNVPQLDDFSGVIEIVDKFREFRENHNWFGGEEYSYSIQQPFSYMLLNAKNSDNHRIMINMLIGELYEFHTWALEKRMSTGGILEAMLHSERLMTYMMFMRISDEINEDLIALQSLLYILNGRMEQALAIAKQGIPEESNMSSAQLMCLICAHIAQFGSTSKEAKKLLIDYSLKAEIVDATGLLQSLHRFSNSCYLFNHTKLAIQILEFIIDIVSNKYPHNVLDIGEKLFLLSRLNPNILQKDTIKQLKNLNINLTDHSQNSVPNSWKKPTTIDEDDQKQFQGNVTILEKYMPFDKPTEFHIIGFEENSRSVWRWIFPRDYLPMVDNALGFRLRGGKITKILSKTRTDPTNVRGTIIVQHPSIQINVQLHV